MSSSSATLAIHPHHHHFYGHEIGHHYHHQHQHHPHIQQHHYHNVQPPSSSASQMTSSSYAAANTLLSGEYPTIGSGTQSTKRCCQSCRCSNRLVTGIIITILPIAITSTLICVFMMQKTNLHQYAIYSFVIFCVAFVFPFALFFFTVVLNKLYKFYKREILSNSPTNINSLMTDSCDSESAAIGGTTISGYNISANNNNNNNNNLNPLSPSNNGGILNRVIVTNAHHSLDTNQSPQSDHQHSHHQHQHLHHYQHSPNGLICYNTRAYHHHPYYYQIQEGTVVALAPDNTLIIEDSPPSYEMALLCPSVNTHNQSTCPNSLIDPSQMQVILPKEKQLISKHNHERSNNDDDSVDNENVEENDDDDGDIDGDVNDEDDEDDNDGNDNDETPKVVTSHNHLLHLHHNHHNHLNHDHNHDDNEENNVQKTDNNTIVDESSESFESSERSNQEETSQSN